MQSASFFQLHLHRIVRDSGSPASMRILNIFRILLGKVNRKAKAEQKDQK